LIESEGGKVALYRCALLHLAGLWLLTTPTDYKTIFEINHQITRHWTSDALWTIDLTTPYRLQDNLMNFEINHQITRHWTLDALWTIDLTTPYRLQDNLMNFEINHQITRHNSIK
jgi:hypothetical protein